MKEPARPRLAHVIAGLAAGGTEMMCLRLVRHWRNQFDQCVIVLEPCAGALEGSFREVLGNQLIVSPTLGRSHVAALRGMQEIIRRQAPAAMLIHSFGVHQLVAAAASRVAGIRTIAAWAGNPPPDDLSARLRWSVVLLASRLLRCPIFSCSNSVDKQLRSLKVGMPKGSGPLANGIRVTDFAFQASEARQLRSDKSQVIGMVSRLDDIKDHATLLRAFAILRPEIPDSELWIIGDGVLRAPLQGLARELGIEPATRFLGTRTDIPDLLGKIDVFAFSTTRNEGFGIALIEAMAARLPIVASDVPACSEVLAAGEAGILVPAGRPERMAEALLGLMQNNAKRRDFAARAAARVQREYSIETCARSWEIILFGAAQSTSLTAACAL